MSERADAHIHLFDGGYQDSFVKRLSRPIDEAVCYLSLAADYGVKSALVVGYADAPWAVGNNCYLSKMATEYDWVYPVAYFDPAKPPTTEDLELLKKNRFVGLSFYIFGSERTENLLRISDEVWAWLCSHQWLVSVNSKGNDWTVWLEVLRRHSELRLIVSHDG